MRKQRHPARTVGRAGPIPRSARPSPPPVSAVYRSSPTTDPHIPVDVPGRSTPTVHEYVYPMQVTNARCTERDGAWDSGRHRARLLRRSRPSELVGVSSHLTGEPNPEPGGVALINTQGGRIALTNLQRDGWRAARDAISPTTSPTLGGRTGSGDRWRQQPGLGGLATSTRRGTRRPYAVCARVAEPSVPPAGAQVAHVRRGSVTSRMTPAHSSEWHCPTRPARR